MFEQFRREEDEVVALLAEGVDRNFQEFVEQHKIDGVALLAEGVDRNIPAGPGRWGGAGRPPRGGRG